MKNRKNIAITILLTVFVLSATQISAQESNKRWWKKNKQEEPPKQLNTLQENKGMTLVIEFDKGEAHNYPLMVFWIEDKEGNYVEDLYVAESIAKGYFGYGKVTEGHWEPGPLRRPAALPYWGHKKGVKAEDGLYIPSEKNPLPDAVSGATPKGNFVLTTNTSHRMNDPFYVMMEINQSWDWNQYWHNNKFPDDAEYKTSSQPALVYRALVDPENRQETIKMEAIGHSHWSGKNGKLYEDLTTISTAMDIVKEITIKVQP